MTYLFLYTIFDCTQVFDAGVVDSDFNYGGSLKVELLPINVTRTDSEPDDPVPVHLNTSFFFSFWFVVVFYDY